MFPTQSINYLQKYKHNPTSQTKIQIDFYELQDFYNNLIDDPIKPNIDNFFILQNKIDLQQKFQKYEQQPLIKEVKNKNIFLFQDQQQIRIQNKIITKNLIFRIPGDNLQRSQNKIIENYKGSKISYFQINQSLKNCINNQSSQIKKSFEMKKILKQRIQNLKQFLYEQESVFFLLKGNIQLQRKIQQQRLQKSNNDMRNYIKLEQSVITRQNNDTDMKNDQISTTMLMDVIDSQNLMRQNQNKDENVVAQQRLIQNQVKRRQWKKYQQIKQSIFFSLINYKSLHNNDQIQYYKLIPKQQCIIAKIKINPQYNSLYIKKQQQKLRILSLLFYNGNKIQNKKSSSFKLLFNSFQQQYIKKDIIISNQGKLNQNIFILGYQSQAEVNKKIYFKQNQNVYGNKNIKICNIKGPSIINAQIILENSKTINNLIRNNSFRTNQDIDITEKQQNQYQTSFIPFNNKNNPKSNELNDNSISQSEFSGLQKMIIQKKRPSHPKTPSLLNNQSKVCFGKSQMTYFQFYLPSINTTNFTIKINSAFATVYAINIKKFLELTSQKMKKKLSKSYEEIYVTFLRKSMQKLQFFEKQIQLSSNIKKNQLLKYAALSSIQKLKRQSPQLKNQKKINLSVAKLQFQNRKQLKGLKREQLVYQEGQILEKKMEMIKYNNKDKINNQILTKNFKKKIENLIVQNLKDINLFNKQRSSNQQKTIPIDEVNKFYSENLNHILDSERSNNSQKYHILLDNKKNSSLQKIEKLTFKHENVIQKDMFVNPDNFDPSKNKYVKISFLKKGHPCVKQSNNYLKGVQMNQYTDSIKSHISVKINETNKIKEQFLQIQSKCQSCKCYDDLDSYRHLSNYHSERNRPFTEQNKHSSQDVKYHTMKIGVNWKTKYSSLGKVESKTSYNQKGKQKRINKMSQDDQPFEKVYNRIKVLRPKSLQKFNFNEHLIKRSQEVRTRKSSKKSAPLLL